VENLNYTSIEAKHERAKYFILEDSLREKITAQFFNENKICFVSSEREATYIIKSISHEQYKISFNHNNSVKSHSLSLKQLLYFISKIEKQFPPKESKSKEIELSKFIKSKFIWEQEHFLFKDLNHLVMNHDDIFSFTQSIFNLSFFENFSTIHLFIHEKGLSTSVHSYINRQNIVHREQDVAEFSNLFLAIKKSKNKSFGQSTLKASNFQIIGTCLAIDLSLSNHNMILVLSKDDFLPQEELDIKKFKRYADAIKTYYDILLISQLNRNKTNSIIQIINIMNNPVLGSNSTIKPKLTKSLSPVDIKNLSKKMKNTDFTVSDSFHKERIELLGDLLNTLKHELSNPLFGMQLSAELLMLEELDADQHSFVKDINTSIKRSQKILTSFSNIYTHKSKLVEINIYSLIQEVLLLTKSESREIKKKITTDHEIESLVIISNPTWLAQIIFNLVINSSQAFKANNTESPTIEITLSLSKNTLQMSLSDNGPGIKSSCIDQIFSPFYTTKETGNGLGLAITKNLITKLKGTIRYNRLNNGSQFLIELPI
jgi:hypothetical protein